jgi:hypothetical protein
VESREIWLMSMADSGELLGRLPEIAAKYDDRPGQGRELDGLSFNATVFRVLA